MDSVITAPTRHRLSVDDYHRMAEAGNLEWGSRVELIDGEIIDMAPIGISHAAAADGLNSALVLACIGRAIVRTQGSVRLNQWSESQPDLAILRPKPDRYCDAHPGPADILLVVEVSDGWLRYDRTVKLALYANAGSASTGSSTCSARSWTSIAVRGRMGMPRWPATRPASGSRWRLRRRSWCRSTSCSAEGQRPNSGPIGIWKLIVRASVPGLCLLRPALLM